MRYKDPNSASKQKILLESFKLFVSKSLSDITFSDIEKATNLSRGTILYHFKTKDQIFTEIVNQFILDKDNKLPVINQEKNLWENIEFFIAAKKKQQAFLTNIGIANANRAYICMTTNAMFFLEDMLQKMTQRRERELQYWRDLLCFAKNRGEIKKEIDEELWAQFFFNIYYGYSYTSMANSNGCDLNHLLEQFRYLYNLMKV
ncbi:TetR/AcrR family transcriptional regulator [uncultured Bacteroides sp.]|uniref:TetR/AcrR family transcriptional regulator n=1 Tax=uncultured Bacteroides sp. TaxID=162156 RepID=UPI0032B11CB0